jgi:hypothetical protein
MQQGDERRAREGDLSPTGGTDDGDLERDRGEKVGEEFNV